jgi:transposase
MGRKAKHSVELTDIQRDEVQRIIKSSSKKISGELRARAKALLCLDELGENRLSPAEVANKAKLHRETVYELRAQFCKEGFEYALYRKKREAPPVAPKVTGDIEAHIIATACSAAPEGKSKWSLKMIANKVVLDDGSGISYETVRRVLKKRGLSPTSKSNG